MNKDEIMNQLKEILNKYPDKQREILLYIFGRDNLIKMINEPTYEELQQENKQLKDNWNELKKWLEENESFDDYCNETTFTSVLEKMLELEQGSDNQ